MLNIEDKIYSYYSNNNTSNKQTSYLGASSIDSSCERKSYYNYHNKIRVESGRILRLFETGKSQEERIINDLENIGIHIYDSQRQFIDKDNPDFGGKPDGFSDIKGVKTLIEIKTHNDKSYKELIKKGVLWAKQAHFDQMQIYMGLSDTKQSIYIAINKNDESIYTEKVLFDEFKFYYLKDLARRILNKDHTNKVSQNKNFFQCKMCVYKSYCHYATT